jgi:hypothetical protein
MTSTKAASLRLRSVMKNGIYPPLLVSASISFPHFAMLVLCRSQLPGYFRFHELIAEPFQHIEHRVWLPDAFQ